MTPWHHFLCFGPGCGWRRMGLTKETPKQTSEHDGSSPQFHLVQFPNLLGIYSKWLFVKNSPDLLSTRPCFWPADRQACFSPALRSIAAPNKSTYSFGPQLFSVVIPLPWKKFIRVVLAAAAAQAYAASWHLNFDLPVLSLESSRFTFPWLSAFEIPMYFMNDQSFAKWGLHLMSPIHSFLTCAEVNDRDLRGPALSPAFVEQSVMSGTNFCWSNIPKAPWFQARE